MRAPRHAGPGDSLVYFHLQSAKITPSPSAKHMSYQKAVCVVRCRTTNRRSSCKAATRRKSTAVRHILVFGFTSIYQHVQFLIMLNVNHLFLFLFFSLPVGLRPTAHAHNTTQMGAMQVTVVDGYTQEQKDALAAAEPTKLTSLQRWILIGTIVVSIVMLAIAAVNFMYACRLLSFLKIKEKCFLIDCVVSQSPPSAP